MRICCLISELFPSCLQSFFFLKIFIFSFPIPDLSPDIVAVLEKKNKEERKEEKREEGRERKRPLSSSDKRSPGQHCPATEQASIQNFTFYKRH